MTDDQEKSSPKSYQFQVKVEGILENKWADWFDGMTISHEENNTILTGLLVDQAALYGLLKQVRDIGLNLISVTRSQPGNENEMEGDTTDQ